MRPARRDEDKIARIMSRAADGLYSGQQLSFASGPSAVELATGRGLCGPADEYGRCISRYHDLECAHGQGTDWLASGPPRETYQASLANLEGSLELASPAPATVWGDPDEPGKPAWEIPSHTVNLAHELAIDWGLQDTPGDPGAQAYLDLLRAPAAPVSVSDVMYESMGLGAPPARPVAQYPGVSEIRRRLGSDEPARARAADAGLRDERHQDQPRPRPRRQGAARLGSERPDRDAVRGAGLPSAE